MLLLAIAANSIGYWGDKLLYVIVLLGCLIANSLATARRRRATCQRSEELDADRAASISTPGPPRFNG